MTKIFSDRLHTLREASDISQKELAVTLKVTAATLSNYENGIYLPPLSKAAQLSQTLHTSLDYLCGLTDTDFDTTLLTKNLTPSMTIGQFIPHLANLSPEDRNQLMIFCDYLHYKQRTRKYMKEPAALKIAEDGGYKKSR